MPAISIVIPVRPGLEPLAIVGLAAVDVSPGDLEILVAEGENPSCQRNEAVRQATGDIIYFLDDDSMVAHDCITRIKGYFSDETVVAVGGPSITPSHDSLLQQCIGAALQSPLGAGSVRNRYRSTGKLRDTTEKELILCNLAIRKDVFLSCGGFDERLYPNEENELLDRLAKSGGRILHDPELRVERSQRPTLAAFARQMFRYGQGRGRQTRIAGIRGLASFVPLGFVIYLCSLPFVSTTLWRIPLLTYCILSLAASLHVAVSRKSLLYFLLLPALFLIIHIFNGLGLLAGFILPLKSKACYIEQPVSVRRHEFSQDA